MQAAARADVELIDRSTRETPLQAHAQPNRTARWSPPPRAPRTRPRAATGVTPAPGPRTHRGRTLHYSGAPFVKLLPISAALVDYRYNIDVRCN